MSAETDFKDFKPLIAAVNAGESSADGWQIESVHPRVFRAQQNDAPVAVKTYTDGASAEREFAVLTALREFGMNLGPEPLALHTDEKPLVVMSWLDANPLESPPAPDDAQMWNRLMAAMGASGAMNVMDYSAKVPMRGGGIQNPRDMVNQIEDMLQVKDILDDDAPTADRLKALLEKIRAQVPTEWNMPTKIGLCRRTYDPANFLWDGHHLMAVDWEHADWGDMAAEVGLLSAHPAYEEIPSSHWVWFRWEFARLTHDDDLVPRATIYARLGQVWWAAKLMQNDADKSEKQRDRYLKRAEKLFR